MKLMACHLQEFFTNFQDKVSVKQFQYDKEIKGTVLEGDLYFGSEETVRAAIPPGKTASYSDLVRYVLLHNYGGLWWAYSSCFPSQAKFLCIGCLCIQPDTAMHPFGSLLLPFQIQLQGWLLGTLTRRRTISTHPAASGWEPRGAG